MSRTKTPVVVTLVAGDPASVGSTGAIPAAARTDEHDVVTDEEPADTIDEDEETATETGDQFGEPVGKTDGRLEGTTDETGKFVRETTAETTEPLR